MATCWREPSFQGIDGDGVVDAGVGERGSHVGRAGAGGIEDGERDEGGVGDIEEHTAAR